ncbi:MAG TPA: hypothetical protein VNE59_09105 [Burkholderiales bacterium]|nr:hypothetical protein [Burkholderiales bacterium]
MAILGKRPMRRLEAALCVLIAAVLAFVLLDRLQRYAELAERSAMETTLASLQTALQVSFMLASAHGGPAAVAARWRGRNPILLVGAPPPTYLGETSKVDLRRVPGGSWLFDSARGQLVYVPRSARSLSVYGSNDPVPALRFALRIDGPPRDAGWVVRLVPVNPYVWSVG